MKKYILLIVLLLVVTGCSQVKEQAETQSTHDSATADSLEEASYRILKLNTSEIRNSNYNEITNPMDFKTVTRELQNLSTPYFSVDDYYMAEGQTLDEADLSNLLTERDKEYSMQPAPDSEIDGVKKPIMISTIYEQDFYTGENGDYQLGGMSVAIVMNPIASDESPLTKSMSDATIAAEGRRVMPILFNYLRNEKGVEVPINICVYRAINNVDTNTNGGYILQAYGEQTLGDIQEVDYQRVIFGSEEAQALDPGTTTSFATLRNHLRELSTESVGIVGYGVYKNRNLSSVKIEVTLNAKTFGETTFFVSKAREVLSGVFTDEIDVEMVIKSNSDTNAVITKKPGAEIETLVLQ